MPLPQTIVILFVEWGSTLVILGSFLKKHNDLFHHHPKYFHLHTNKNIRRSSSPSCLISNYGRSPNFTSVIITGYIQRSKTPLKAGRKRTCTFAAIFVGQLYTTDTKVTFTASPLDNKNKTMPERLQQNKTKIREVLLTE